MNYPETKRGETVDEFFGTRVADPYRWLENDARSDEDVAAWVAAQNSLSKPYLAALPGREAFHRRLTALFNHEVLTTPVKRGDRLFFTRNKGLDNQPTLLFREGTSGADHTVIDPNGWSKDATTALAEWAPSEDGTLLAFATQEAGSDWRTIRVMEVESGRLLEDEIAWARFTNIAWAKDGSGFFYSRFPEPDKGSEFAAPVAGHAVYFHTLNTPQARDLLVYAPQDQGLLLHTVEVTADGRYAVIYSSPLSGGNTLTVVDLSTPDWTPRTIVESADHSWTLVGNRGPTLILSTQKDAERGKIVSLEFRKDELEFTTLIPEKDAVLRGGASLVGNRLIVPYLIDAKTQVERYRLDGTFEGTVELPGIGSVGPFEGRPGDNEAFYVFTSHDAPFTIHRYDVAANKSEPWAEPKVATDLDRVQVEQRFYASKDGTRVPLFIVRRKDIALPAPTMLFGYGGFSIPMVPYFSPAAMAWVEQGGIYAVANIRGGGEYGKKWHDAGRRDAKQNSFDDFIAAGEFMKAEGITSADGLAIHGQSNGGLLIGAVVNQRPDLFDAALPDVAVTDMLRFKNFVTGEYWVQEFGDPAAEADFRTLLGYSPLHNIRAGANYPAVLVTTADTDNRVVPSNSFKYVAALQAAEIGQRPHLLRVETNAGHGSGKPTDKMLDEFADMWAFAAHWTGLKAKAPD